MSIIILLFFKDIYITKTFEDFNNRTFEVPFLTIHRYITIYIETSLASQDKLIIKII